MRLFAIACVIALLQLCAICSLEAQLYTPQSEAIGLASVADKSAWGASENPANTIEAPGFAVQAYGQTLSQGVGLSRIALDVLYRSNLGAFQLGVQHFDPPGFRLTGIHAGASRQLADGLSAGIRVGVVRGDLDEYGSYVEPVAQAGVTYAASSTLQAAAHYVYVATPRLPLAGHQLRVGFDYASSPRVHLLAHVTQAVNQRLAGGFGMRFKANERLQFAAGIRTGGLAYTLGVEAALPQGLRFALTAIAYQELPLGAGYGIRYHKL